VKILFASQVASTLMSIMSGFLSLPIRHWNSSQHA